MNLVWENSRIIIKITWDEFSAASKSLYNHLILKHIQLLFKWVNHLMSLLHGTCQYLDSMMAEEKELEFQWKEFLGQCLGLGEEMETPFVWVSDIAMQHLIRISLIFFFFAFCSCLLGMGRWINMCYTINDNEFEFERREIQNESVNTSVLSRVVVIWYSAVE